MKLVLSHCAVRRDDPAESAFIAMLAGPKGGGLLNSGAPFAAVVFGRGRVFGAWPAEELTDERLDQTNLFATRACSCEVKSLNPGWDLLMNVDWDAELRKVHEARKAPPAAALTEPPQSAAPVLVPIAAGTPATRVPHNERTGILWPFAVGAALFFAIVIALSLRRHS